MASDECYAELDWRPRAAGSREPPTTPSILDPRVTGGSHEGLLCVYSLSKQSNLAGYRGAFVAGDPALVGRLLEVRKHAGMMVPWPVQRAVLAALADADHVAEQKARYAARRAALLPAVEAFGLRVDDSEAGLYLWATRGGGRPGDDRAAGRAAASSRRRATSTAPPGASTCASRSPRPTSASRRPFGAWARPHEV